MGKKDGSFGAPVPARDIACVAVVSVSFSQAGQARKTREGNGKKVQKK